MNEEVQMINDMHIEQFRVLSGNINRLKMDREAINDDKKALAKTLGWKISKLNKVLRTIESERTKGGVITESNEVNELAQEIVNKI